MRKKVWSARGRPSGGYHSYGDIRVLEYLARISVKYEIDSARFFNSFLKAFRHQESTCGKLSIECRMMTQDYAIFLITTGQEVVAQFPVSNRILAKTNPIEEFSRRLSFTRKPAQETKPNHYPIKGLRAGMKHINIKARVLEISQPRFITTRFGSYASVANAIITDETGTIRLPLWNKQIEGISAGDRIQVEKANVVVFRGALQLKVGRSGKLNVIKNS